MSEISLHSATCKKAIDLAEIGVSPIELVNMSEIDTFGSASVLCSMCKGCLRDHNEY